MKAASMIAILAIVMCHAIPAVGTNPQPPGPDRTDAQAPRGDCAPSVTYTRGAVIRFDTTRTPDASGEVSSATYTAPDGATVAVTTFHYDTRQQTLDEVAKLTRGGRVITADARCSRCGAVGQERRVVFERAGKRESYGVLRISDLGLTFITTQALANALDVECLLFLEAGSAPATPPN
jgi:hypothetical protein